MDVTPINGKSSINKPKSNKSIQLSPTAKKIIFGILGTVIVIALFICTYKYGYNKGYKKGEEAGKKASVSTKPTDLLKGLDNPFKTLTGTVEKFEGDTLTMTTSKGETKTVKVNDKVKITKKTETLNTSALKKDTKVTVFTNGDEKNLVATRIVVQTPR